MDRILPVEAARTEKGLFDASRKRSERWARIARESSQQSRRVRIPEILPAVRFERCLEQTAAHRYFLDEALAPPLLREIPAERSDSAALLIGPEGGWTDAERQLAIAAALAAGLPRTPGASCGNSRLRRPGRGRECVAILTIRLTA